MSDPNAIPSTADSPWNHKPWWCQPWSIVLTGVGLMAASWLLFHAIWITTLVAIPVLAWMGFFLILWPDAVMRNTVLETNHDLEATSRSEDP